MSERRLIRKRVQRDLVGYDWLIRVHDEQPTLGRYAAQRVRTWAGALARCQPEAGRRYDVVGWVQAHALRSLGGLESWHLAWRCRRCGGLTPHPADHTAWHAERSAVVMAELRTSLGLQR